ncbi:MAG: RidA family protein [Pyrinomonadaceae bacterium]
MTFETINPKSLGYPPGYSNGMLANTSGRVLFIAGQVGWNEHQQFVNSDFVEQFDLALANVLAVVTAAGGASTDIGKLTIYVTSRDEYGARTREVGERYRARMGKHFPAMVLIEVSGLLLDAAKVEIDGIAVLPE